MQAAIRVILMYDVGHDSKNFQCGGLPCNVPAQLSLGEKSDWLHHVVYEQILKNQKTEVAFHPCELHHMYL